MITITRSEQYQISRPAAESLLRTAGVTDAALNLCDDEGVADLIAIMAQHNNTDIVLGLIRHAACTEPDGASWDASHAQDNIVPLARKTAAQ